jgi:multiple sugar transport system substrate-binding protein
MHQEALTAIKPAMDAQQITITWNPDPGGGWNKVMSMFAAGTAFDIQRIDDDRVYLLAVEGKIHQLDRFMADSKLNKNDYFPLFFTSLAVEGYQYSMNPAGGANVVYYNQDLFEKAGVKAPTSWKEAWSWEEAWDNFRKLAKKGSGGKTDVYALGFPANISTPTGYGNGAQAFNADETKCGFNGPDVMDVLDPIIQATVKEQIFPTPDLDRTELFNAGKLAMLWESMGIDRNFSKQVKWEVMPWFKSKKRAMTENYDRTFTIAKSAKDPEAAFLGLKALCEKDAGDVYARGRFGMPYFKASAEGPVFNDPSKPPKNKNVWFETFDVVDGQPVDVPTPRGPIGEAWKEAFTSELFDGARAGQMSTKDFLDQASKRVDDTIAKFDWKKGKGMELLQKGGNLDANARFYTR